MKPIYQTIGLIFLLTVVACDQQPGSAGMEAVGVEEMVAPKTAPPPPPPQAEVEIERKLIKEGRVEFETNDLPATRKTVFAAIHKYEAYISSDEEYTYSGRKSNTLVIRVPAEDFDSLLAAATRGIDRFDSKQINVKDVTEEFLDIQARLETKKELEERYLSLLQRANTVTEILEIEKEIGNLRSEIESIEGRLQYLENRVGYSTLSLTFYESIPEDNAFAQKFKKGFRNGGDNLIWFFVGLVNIWPFILIGIALILGVRWYRKRKKK
ncbi:MAG TPA: DUF4349 domain-containing protein [Saprospiraceae bacterium]|nr:DUF4349 domain-containing protein [Saprospiraceae bacterium]